MATNRLLFHMDVLRPKWGWLLFLGILMVAMDRTLGPEMFNTRRLPNVLFLCICIRITYQQAIIRSIACS
jgi:hypothetical protein